MRLYRLDHRYEGRDTFSWYRGTKAEARAAYAAAFPNGATVEQFNAWVDANLAPFPDRRDALRQWIADTGGMLVVQIVGIKRLKMGLSFNGHVNLISMISSPISITVVLN